jgi:diguanylate cyclase (GGDEF)-like protein/PAS domain S-box-containing protein
MTVDANDIGMDRPGSSPGPVPLHDRMLAQMLEEFPEAVVVLGLEGHLLWANAMAESLFGRSLHTSIGQLVLDLVHPDDLELVLRSFESVQTKPVGTFLEVRVTTATGWRLVEVVGIAVPWFEQGGILFGLRDLTERRRFEVAHDDVARFRSLQQHAATIAMIVTAGGRIGSVSAALTRRLGHDPELMENKPLADLVVVEDRPALADALERALQGATAALPVMVEVGLLRHGSTESVPFELTIVNLVDDPTVEGFVITAHDISARVSVEFELRNTLSLLQATLDSTADGILVVDAGGTVTNSNARFVEMWRLPNSLLTSRDDGLALDFVADQLLNPEAFLAKVQELYAQPEAESNDTIVFKDGRVFERYSKPQLVDGKVVGRVWSFSDVTERKELENELSYQAFHDALTGLANKALFRDRLNLALARLDRTRSSVAVLFLDVDDFKLVNDSLGHSIGDELLRGVASALSGCLRHADTAARLGGDEFAVLVEDIDQHHEAIRLAERILEVLRKPIMIGNQELSITVSIGITFGVSGSTSEDLLSKVDLAMYMAKRQGKNRYEEFQVQMHDAVVERHGLQADFRKALVASELVVHYQPIIELSTDRIVGFEALVRWQHPTKGLLAPATFIPIAEEIGLIDVVDRFVLGEACGQARHWQDWGLAPLDLAISVNLSAHELMDATIAASVAESLRTCGFDPANLIMEITESAMMKDIDAAVEHLQSLKALGLRIALDDFGTGYSSLAHLERLPIDILKIDRSFVATLGSGETSANLAQAIIQLADTLGHETIAEGVESTSQADHLAQMGCRLAQGYYLGMPLDARATEELLRLRVDLSTI